MSAWTRVVIAGAGCVGSALACALASRGVPVVLLDPQPPPQPGARQAVDPRVYALTLASQAVLEGLGAWDAVRPGACPYERMEVWDAEGTGSLRFDAAETGECCLGHIVEPHRILAALAACGERFGVERRRDRVTDFQVHARHVEVWLASGDRMEAALLVGADGAGSRVRTLAGIPLDVLDYAQTAVVATVRTELPHGRVARQRFMPSGPLAFLPLADGRSAIVWTTTPEAAEELLALDEADFCAAVTEAFGRRLGRVLSAEARAGFPLRRRHAAAYVQPRLALVGDAAHTIHPLAGQGVNLGLLDAAALAQVVAQARRRGRDPGALPTLRRYERWRRGDNLMMMRAMDGFRWLFGPRPAPVREVRNLGLRLVDRLVPVKQLLARRAMGLTGDLPELARYLP
ncbi:MAG: 2-octaprenyl-3-methyl-6-methoxy-1,4-benzoquinol hydroxylase [Gammaproteobacteria bacterium]|nr:MAG: 2-octaprenyl-3-methyl-6-methoxy-1,4-benzoquinol hydroxylase [Gammaproteobacteria bacterium]